MKLTTNFVTSPVRWVRPMTTVLWGLTGLAAVLALWLVQAAIEAHHEIPALRERLAQLEQRKRAVPTTEKPPLTELQDIKRRIAALNALSVNQGRPVITLLTDLEQWLPDPVWLVSLHDRVKNGEVLIVAEAHSVEPLTSFLLRLEQQPRFSEVLLVKQTPRGAQRHAIQFEIRLKERS